MRGLIEIHNKSTYQRIYNNFSSEFIDSYCEYRLDGLNSLQSLESAKSKLHDHLVVQLKQNRPSYKTVLKAYNNVRNDSQLIGKAIRYYQRNELTKKRI